MTIFGDSLPAEQMDREKLQTFVRAAETELASIRSSLLMIAQTGDTSDLVTARRNLALLKSDAAANLQSRIAELAVEGEVALMRLAGSRPCKPAAVYAVLDQVALIEAAVFDIPLNSDDFLADVSELIESSFEGFLPTPTPVESDEWADEEFEIDEETFDIFRSEADELLVNISHDLSVLRSAPNDKDALWNIRRHAHTFKGAAGIVGLKNASEIAHRMEDLLDKMVELEGTGGPQVVEFLASSAAHLTAIVEAKDIDGQDELDRSYDTLIKALSSKEIEKPQQVTPPETPLAPATGETRVSTPIVRVSLDKLDDLLKISRDLLSGHAGFVQTLSGTGGENLPETLKLADLKDLLVSQQWLIDDLYARLLQIRMVRFGTLETRLGRTVQVTSIDEGKKAAIEIENGEVEIDTRTIDALIEPLLHLIKNAVVHGIELPETRRLLRKPERGTIKIRVETDEAELRLAVTDDGAGISAARLREKAVGSGIVSAETAVGMSDAEAIELIFDRGLTTAAKIDLNAGRGVGMSIVKESVEARGGSVSVESKPQKGTTFTIKLPLSVERPKTADTIAQTQKDEKPSENATPLVLIVDDSGIIRRHNSKLVEKAGFETATANGGTDALAKMRSETRLPDLILSDVEMPEMDGWEFLKNLKKDDRLKHIPVVMVTSVDPKKFLTKAIEFGAADFVEKPFTEAGLERVVELMSETAAG